MFKDTRIELACFSFRAGLLFFLNFSSFKPIDAVSSKGANFDEVQYF